MLPFNEGGGGGGDVTEESEITSDLLLRDADVAMEEVRTCHYYLIIIASHMSPYCRFFVVVMISLSLSYSFIKLPSTQILV